MLCNQNISNITPTGQGGDSPACLVPGTNCVSVQQCVYAVFSCLWPMEAESVCLVKFDPAVLGMPGGLHGSGMT